MVEVDPGRFEAMVTEALDGLPADLGDLMSNVAVTVEHGEGPAGLCVTTARMLSSRYAAP